MTVSTRGRYALRVMVDLAEHDNGEFIPLSDIADRQEISEKYLESIVAMLSKSGFVQSLRGKGGGYRLAKKPEEYTIRDILEVTEGSLEPVPNLNNTDEGMRASVCREMDMWRGLYKAITDYLDSVTIRDIAGTEIGQYDFVI